MRLGYEGFYDSISIDELLKSPLLVTGSRSTLSPAYAGVTTL